MAEWSYTRVAALPDRDLTFIDGIPVTTVERTIFDLCAVRGPKTVDLAIDNALRRSLTTFEHLAATSAASDDAVSKAPA